MGAWSGSEDEQNILNKILKELVFLKIETSKNIMLL